MTDPRQSFDDETLRQAFRSLSNDATFGPNCPSADRLWEAAHGELPPDQIEVVVAHIVECGACAEAWRVARDFGPAFAQGASAGKEGVPAWWFALAASLAVIVGASMFYLTSMRNDSGDSAAGAITTSTPASPTFLVPIEKADVRISSRYALTWRGPGEGRRFLQMLSNALEPYRRDDYNTAADRLGALTATYPDAAEPWFYLGVSRLLLGDAARAIAPLERARDVSPADQIEEARWFLAAAYERAGQPEAARAEVRAVCDAKGARATAACAAVPAR